LNKAELQKLKEEFKMRHPDQPDPTTYNPFERDTWIPFDFGKWADWFEFEDHDKDKDLEGDVLVLEADKPKKKVPGFDLSKM